ncbi:ABC transporter permease [Flindersiella endophytica]
MSATTLVVDTEPEEREGGRRSIIGWIAQPLVAVALFIGVLIFSGTADLDAVASRQITLNLIGTRMGQHLLLTAVSTVLVLVIAVPLGILVTRRRTRVLAPFFVGIANIGQAAPSVGLLVLIVILTGRATVSGAIAGLTAYAVLPVLRNTITGLQGIDPRLIEAGRGMGMSAAKVMFRIELPLAVPVILTGIRTALVLLVGTATLAAFVNGGGLGLMIVTGLKLNRTPVIVVGGLLVAALALLIDWMGQVIQQIARPKGV